MNKPGRLTEDEFELVKRHTEVGYAMVSASPTLEDAGPVVRGHHERVDGRGYPDALAGDDIPFGARIVAACDAYDAMANTRQYREGMGRAKAVSVLHEHSGAQWDEAVVDALVRVLARGEPERDPRVFDEVGRAPDDDLLVCQCCQDALPEQALQS